MFYLKIVTALFILSFVSVTSWAQEEHCPPHPVTIQGNSLSPLIQNVDIVMMKPVSCVEKIMRSDFVIFHTGAHEQPVIKIVKALPGDSFNVVEGYIFVNDEKLLTSNGEAYHLTENHSAMLLLYQRNYDGIVPPNSYIVLGDRPGGAIDSTRIGLIHRSDIIMTGGVSL
ncbi:MAG: signal peptidase I [Gammaproteobacteria bacterium]|nr:signal peptidase I [Gammaproteobacteria bacterium]